MSYYRYSMSVKIIACQVPDIRQNVEGSLRWIEQFTIESEKDSASIVLFPECFLQGYLTEESIARKFAMNLSGELFEEVLKKLAKYKPVIVFGMIEEDNGHLYNTAVVVKSGKLIGRYRKTHLLDGERIFSQGSEYPVFEVNGAVFGINICYDTQFVKSATAVASQGAQIILCPANNMMRRENAEKYKELHHKIRAERAKENKVWIVSSDVTGQTEERIAYGPTSIISPLGKVTEQVPLMKTGVVSVEI